MANYNSIIFYSKIAIIDTFSIGRYSYRKILFIGEFGVENYRYRKIVYSNAIEIFLWYIIIQLFSIAKLKLSTHFLYEDMVIEKFYLSENSM